MTDPTAHVARSLRVQENPVQVIAVGALAVTAAAKLLDAMSAAQGRRAYAKQINHKVNMK